MHVYHIRTKNDISKIEKVNKHIENGNHVFVLVYMEGCGPCNATRPEWNKLESVLKSQYANNNNLIVVDINKDFLSDLKHIGQIDGFPTMKHISGHGKKVTSFENSPIKRKDRTADSFIHWIETMMDVNVSETHTNTPQDVYERISKTHKIKSKKNMRGGKWTRKYKRSINCRRPRGFSQKQYCKYGRRK